MALAPVGLAVILAVTCALPAGCAGFPMPGMGGPPKAEAGEPEAPPPATAAPAEAAAPPAVATAPDPVDEAEALIARDQVDAAMALLKRTLDDGSARAEDALYWIAVLSFGPPISDPEQGRAALARLLAEYPHGARRHAAAAMKALVEEDDRLATDNAALKGDLQKLLNIDVEAQRQRRGTTAAPAPAPPPTAAEPAAP